MAEKTGIAWTDSTFNPWIGCTKVGPGCDHCYAEAADARFYQSAHWGAGSPRRLSQDSYWEKPLAWNLDAQAKGVRRKVFCASQADVFDNEVPAAWRERLWALVRRTPWLDWQLVTKRVGNVATMLPADWGEGYGNVWLLATVVTQKEADRDVPKLLAVPAAVRGLSMEPLLEPVVLPAGSLGPGRIGWVIVGGESMPNAPREARRFDLAWARALQEQATAAGAAFFMKQTGHNPAVAGTPYHQPGKGEVPTGWPRDLRVRDFPTPVVLVARPRPRP